MKAIEVIIGKDGAVSVEAKGYSGNECLKATEELEKALGLAGKRTEKPEMRQRTQSRKVGQR